MSDIKDKVKELEQRLVCQCDLDKWEPERDTGHSWVCPIHRLAKGYDNFIRGYEPHEKAIRKV